MKLSVLYVEDDENDVFFFQRAVDSANLNVNTWTVSDGDVAIQWLHGKNVYSARDKYPMPDVLVLDLKLPRINGFSVLESIRSNPVFRNLTVIVYSSSLQKRDVTVAMASGASRFIGKTSDCAELMCHLKQVISRKIPAMTFVSSMGPTLSASI